MVKPKKAGILYKAGKGFKTFFSGISGESKAESRRVEESAKERILNSMFMRDLRAIKEDFNLSDPEESVDPETDKVVKKTRTLDEWRRYVRERVRLVDLENYVARFPELRASIDLGRVRSSNVAVYAEMMAALRQEIHWVQYNIIDVLKSEDLSSYDLDSYTKYWSGEVAKNLNRFKRAEEDLLKNRKRLVSLGFNDSILTKVVKIAARCRAQFAALFRQVNEATYAETSLESSKSSFEVLDDELYGMLRVIRGYGRGYDVDAKVRSRREILVELRKHVNDLFLSRFNMRLLREDEKSLEQISKGCNDNESLITNLAALGTIVDKIDVKELKLKLQYPPNEGGSINVLQEFLKENFPGRGQKIIQNLRDIVTLRNQWPIHDNTSKGVTLVMKIYGSYPVDDKNEFWTKILDLYTESMSGIRDLFQL